MQSQSQSKKGQARKPKEERCTNPYSMPRRQVQAEHFADARLYDQSITEPGWEVPYARAKQEYNKWLNRVRRQPGWEKFRVPPREPREPRPDHTEGQVVTVTVVDRTVPTGRYVAPTHSNMSTQKQTVAQSKVKGATIEDDAYRARVFTERMGKEIAQTRTALNLTQAQLAKQINVDANMIRQIELGGSVPFNPEDLLTRSLAHALKLTHIAYHE